MNEQSHLTNEEREVLDLLAQAWNAFAELLVQHVNHKSEMAGFIHQAQRLVMARPTSRVEGWVIALPGVSPFAASNQPIPDIPADCGEA